MDRKLAFTLAEVLITLGIIGVVAAMTMPSLIAKHREKVTVAKVKKVYSILSQGYLFAVQKYGTPDEWGITDRDAGGSTDAETYSAENALLIRNRLLENVKTIQTCDNAKNQKGCGFADKYYRVNSNTYNKELTGESSKTCSALLADGSSVIFMAERTNSSRGTGALSHTYALIYIDVNGLNGPNTYGKDLFCFYLTKYNITPWGVQNDTVYPFPTACYSLGGGCTAWVIYNENMDYLHCNDLNWGGKTKCK